MAIECDTVAREQDPRITDAEGSSVSTYDSFKMYGNTRDLSAAIRKVCKRLIVE